MLHEQRIIEVAKLGELLRAKNWTVSCAESCTGGGVANAFTAVSGSSDWFERSWVTYSNAAKHELMGVPKGVLESVGAVSEQTVEAMAKGCAEKANAQLAVSVSGIVGPGGGSKEKPVGLVWFGVYCDGKAINKKRIFDGDRESVRQQAIDYALALLVQSLVE
jgi:nicotinamide-nucleotide amidase